MDTSDTLIVDRRFNGPPASGNGGWVAGALARRLGAGAVSVSLRSPPPLDATLAVRRLDDRSLALFDGERLLAQAEAADLEGEAPASPGLEAARAAGAVARMRAASRRGASPYAHCFGCGIARRDGLRIIPGPVGEEGMVATDWTPSRPPGDDTATAVDLETTWAALDCPAGFAWNHQLGESPPMMTARMTARVERPLEVDRTYVVIGWPIAREGRKLHAGTAIFDADGCVMARSRQLWLLPRA